MSGHAAKGQVVGYARVSAEDQNEARQLEALGEVDRLFIDKASGKDTDRPSLKEMLAYIREGDTLKVKSIDRLSRSTIDLLSMVKVLRAKGVCVEFVDTPYLNVDTSQGALQLTIFIAFAEFERAAIRERQAEGIAIAKRKGVYARHMKLSDDQIETAREQIRTGVPKTQVARRLGVSRQTLYNALDGSGAYAGHGSEPSPASR